MQNLRIITNNYNIAVDLKTKMQPFWAALGLCSFMLTLLLRIFA